MENVNERESKNQQISTSSSDSKPKIVVIMGPTGAGKSKLAIDLASHFPIEIVNADSMQVYKGLDVLTNKVPLQEQKGVHHYLLGTISPDREFTAKDFRDSAMPLIYDIWSRNCLPVIVGGTNYYIQALVSPLLLDDSAEDVDESCLNDPPGEKGLVSQSELVEESLNYSHEYLKEIDPVAANRIHPNDKRKIAHYLGLYARFGVQPSKLLQGMAMEKWGRVENFRYNCCFLCVDASLTAIDHYVEQRVDCMVEAGLLTEVYDIYHLHADYTRGLRQAIGVREFENFLRVFGGGSANDYLQSQLETKRCDEMFKENLHTILNTTNENPKKLLLEDSINKMKVNTRRLVRRQKRRLNRLQMLFGWNIHYFDTTKTLQGSSNDSWVEHVVEPSVKIIKSFLQGESTLWPHPQNGYEGFKLVQRDLWTQFVCKACGDKVLRGAHEWEQHKQGRSHRKRMSRLKKSGSFCSSELP